MGVDGRCVREEGLRVVCLVDVHFDLGIRQSRTAVWWSVESDVSVYVCAGAL